MYFKDIIGQEEIKKQLIHSAQTGVVPHAQLLRNRAVQVPFLWRWLMPVI